MPKRRKPATLASDHPDVSRFIDGGVGPAESRRSGFARPSQSKISKPPYGKTHRSGTAKNTWNDVIDRWDRRNSNEAWRNADSSLIPEYVPPSGSLNDLMKKSVDRDADKLRKQLARIADVSKGSQGRRA